MIRSNALPYRFTRCENSRMSGRVKFAASFVALLLVLSILNTVDQSYASKTSTQYAVGLTKHQLKVKGNIRTFLVYVPKRTKSPKSIVLVLHGGGGRGLEVATPDAHPLSVFRKVADRERFVVVYPEGLPSNDLQKLTGWVDCRSDNLVSSGADDVAFLESLVRKLTREFRLKGSEVFMAGGSNGAQMTQAFAFHHPTLIGGIASGAGSLPLVPKDGKCSEGPTVGVPILLIHGTADSQMPYEGGCVANIGGSCNRGKVISAVATRDRWLAINGLLDVTPVEEIVELATDDGGPARRYRYDGKKPVEWWQLEGAGHANPSFQVLIPSNRLMGIQNRDIEFAEIAWAFFSRIPG